MTKSSPIKLSIIDYFMMLVYGVITCGAFILNNKLVYISLGCCILCYYTFNIIKNPIFVISLVIAAAHPFSLTLGQSEIPLISALSIIYCFSLSIFVYICKNRSFVLSKYQIKFILGITLFLIFLFLKLYQGNFNSVGTSQFINFLGFGYLECIAIVILFKNKSYLDCIVKPCIFFFVSYTIAFLVYDIYIRFDIDVLDKIENPIGISYFLIINCFYIWFTLANNKKFKIYSICMAILLCLLIGQRSFMVGLIIIGIILMIKYGYIKQLFFGMITMIIIGTYCFNKLYTGDNYKLNLLLKFFEHPGEYIKGISGINFSEAHNSIGTIGSRLYMWYLSINETDPILGKGLGTFSNLMEDEALSYPHNIFFETFYLFGWVGFIIMSIYIFKTLNLSYKTIQLNSHTNWIPLSIFLLFIILLFSSSITGLFVYFIIYSYMLSIIKFKTYPK